MDIYAVELIVGVLWVVVHRNPYILDEDLHKHTEIYSVKLSQAYGFCQSHEQIDVACDNMSI